MAYSGTTNQTKVNVAQMIEFAFREAGKPAEEQTPEYIDAGKLALFYILQNLSNRGVNLWMLENYMSGTVKDQTIIQLPQGTVDVREANWRYIITPQVSGALPASNATARLTGPESLPAISCSR